MDFKIVLILFCEILITQGDYQVGVGIGDCTGPITEINFVSILYKAQLI